MTNNPGHDDSERGLIIDIDLDNLSFSIEIQTRADRYISTDIARDKVWEPFETRVFRTLCEPSGCVIDIGANMGWYSLVASACVGPHGVVLALEPEPHNYSLLVRNLTRNGADNVTARQLAVADRKGASSLFLSDENLGDHRLFEGDERRDSTSVKLATLDDLVQTLGRKPTLIKSDTQGSEWAIVRYVSERTFDVSACCWIIEFWPHGLAGMNAEPKQLLDWFSVRGYRFYELSEGNPQLVGTDPEKLLQRAETDLDKVSQRFINLLLIHPRDHRLANIRQFLN